MEIDLEQILKGLGLSKESVHGLKLARGVVGKASWVVGTTLVVLGVIALRIPPELLLWLVLGLVGVVVIYLVAIFVFADRHPGPALLEGAELIIWQRTEMAAKGLGTIPAGTALPDPAAPALPPTEPLDRSDEEPS